MKKKMTLKKKGLNINTYGYDYKGIDFVCTMIIFIVAVSLVCYLHNLAIDYSAIVILTAVLFLPVMISSFYFYKREKTRFDEYCQYFEYMKLYFKTYKKIKLALEQVEVMFPEKSNMRKCIRKAIDEINMTGNYHVALNYIDKDYHNSYLERLHNLLITGEEHGSDSVYENLDLINYDSWKEDTQMFQAKKKTFRYIMYGMTLFSLGLSYYGANMFMDSVPGFYENADYQLYTFIDIEAILLLFAMLYVSFVNKKWVRSDG